MAVATRILENIQIILAVLCVLVVFQYRAILSFPDWLFDKQEGTTKEGSSSGWKSAAGVTLFMIVLLGAAMIGASQLPDGDGGWLEATFVAPFALSGWVAGRFGGRYGLACAIHILLLFLLFIPLAACVALILTGADPVQGKATVDLLIGTWLKMVVPIAPLAIILTVGAAIWGARSIRRPGILTEALSNETNRNQTERH